MAVTIIKEAILSKEVLRAFDKELVIFPWANTEYEGEIAEQGDTVSVEVMPQVAWTTGGTAGTAISDTNFVITKEQIVADTVAQISISVKGISKKQSNLDLHQKIAREIAYAKSDLLDQFIASFYADANIPSGNKINSGGAVALTKTNVYERIEAMGVKLDQYNVKGERALFVAPAVASLIRQSPMFDGYREGLDIRRSGLVGRIAGFTVFKTNNGPSNRMLGMTKEAMYFVMNFAKMKVTDGVDGFYERILGELVYGGKVFTVTGQRIVTDYYSL